MVKPVITKDGSSTLLHEGYQVHYHSVFGAETESKHVFISNGLQFLYQSGVKNMRLLEIGFGTGLNALLTLQFAVKHPDLTISYTALEPFPIGKEMLTQLRFDFGHFSEAFFQLHETAPEHWNNIERNFKFRKILKPLQNWQTNEKYQLIYFDAFAPTCQPELWTVEAFEAIPASMGAVLTTYCAQGQARRNLKAAGYNVQKLPGPPGKREMTRAIKSA